MLPSPWALCMLSVVGATPAVDAYLIVGIGDHSVADDVYGIDIPTFSHQLRCHIHGQRSQVRVSDEEYLTLIYIYLY